MGIVRAKDLDLSKVTLSEVKTDVHGRKMIYINMDGGKITLQTPKMKAPNGVKKWHKKDATDNKDDRFELELAFNGEDGTDRNSQEIREFHRKLEEFDEMLKQKVLDNAKNWLQMPKLDRNTLESVLYSPMVRVPKDKDGNELPYPSRVKVKIDRDDSTGTFLSNKKFRTRVMMFDENKQELEFNEDTAEHVVPKSSQVVAIVELVYLSLSKTSISTKWKLVQGKVFKNEESITGYALLEDDVEEEDLDSDQHVVMETELKDLNLNGEDDSEESPEQEHEHEHEQEPEQEEPETAPEPVKKRVVRKK